MPDRPPTDWPLELDTQRIGCSLLYYETIGSTNDLVFELARGGSPDGVVVLADRQTHGRGRQGRPWQSPAGCGLWFSILLRPDMPRDRTGALSIMAVVGVARAIEQAGLSPQIKWPNDLLLDGRKCAGILVETKSDLGDAFVLGIGINVNQTPEQIAPELRKTATSLRLSLGHQLGRPTLFGALLTQLDAAYADLLAGRDEALEAYWVSRCCQIGRPVRLRQDNREYRGTIVRLSLKGGIVLALESGGEQTFRSEHCSLVNDS